MRPALLLALATGCGHSGLYSAIYAFDGSPCGSDGEGDDAWCIEGDRCVDEDKALCEPVSTMCDPQNAEEVYDAIYDFDGRICGKTSDGDDAWCKEGDRCVNAAKALCAVVLSPCLDDTP